MQLYTNISLYVQDFEKQATPFPLPISELTFPFSFSGVSCLNITNVQTTGREQQVTFKGVMCLYHSIVPEKGYGYIFHWKLIHLKIFFEQMLKFDSLIDIS